jgi:3-oxoacyl-[acyl-carrier protein] reductase
MKKTKRTLTALVTGASRGIGREIALQLGARGVKVGVSYHREHAAAAEEVLDLLPGRGHAVFRADMGSPKDVDRLWAEAAAHFGRVDIVVNNAAVYREHPPLSTAPAAWRKAWEWTLAANLTGPACLSHLAARAMAEAGGGRIVNISSRGAFRGEPDAPAYGASKAGLNALSQSLAKALAPSNVLVFCLAPGWVDTDMAAGFALWAQGRRDPVPAPAWPGVDRGGGGPRRGLLRPRCAGGHDRLPHRRERRLLPAHLAHRSFANR